VIVVVTLLLVGCLSPRDRLQRQTALSIEQDFPGQRFRLALANRGPKPVCVSQDHWPFDEGYISADGNGAEWDPKIIEGDKVYEPLWIDGSHCSQRCGYRIEPGETLRGSILFDQFETGDFSKPNPDRRLQFRVRVGRCDVPRGPEDAPKSVAENDAEIAVEEARRAEKARNELP